MTALRAPSGVYLVTITGCGCLPETQLLIDAAGRVADLSGAAVTSADVSIVQHELCAAGVPDLAEQVVAWWQAQF